MKKSLKMKYLKARKIQKNDNSERSLVLRQQYAIKMLEFLEKGFHIICID